MQCAVCLVIGLFYTASQFHEFLFGVMAAAFFLFQAVFNTGCIK
jgi:hypothetical protein